MFLSFFLGFFGGANISSSQQDSSSIKITYNVSHLIDTMDQYAVLKYSAVLFIGENSSLFESKNKLFNDSLDKLMKEQLAKNGSSFHFTPPPPKRITSFESAIIYKDFRNKKILEKVSVSAKSYIIKDSINRINWRIKDSIINIRGYRCQAANTTYKGRKWFVWFCKDIPVSNGPWKLGGLPGLIILAYDEKKEIKFEFSELTIASPKKEINVLEKGVTIITQKEYLRLLHAYAEDPQKFLDAQTGSIFKNINPVFSNGATSSPTKLKPPNNPIELN